MKSFLLILILGFGTLNSNGQVFFEKIQNEVCEKIDNIDISSTKKLKLQQLSNTIFTNSILQNIKSITEYKTKLRKEFPLLNNDDISKKVQLEILFYLYDNCPKYLEITKNFSQQREYPDKKCLKLIGDEFCQDFEKINSKDFYELNELYFEFLGIYVVKNAKQIEKDYSNGISNSDFRKDLIAYLFRNCDIYFKMNLYINAQ